MPALVMANDLREAVSALSEPVLETNFWACDFHATRGAVPVDGAVCAAVTDELKHRKFGGSFEEFLAWWQQNKAAVHGQLEAVERSRSKT